MRPELEIYHLIDRYLKGELQGEEFYAFEEKLRNDKGFAEEVALQMQTNMVVKGAAFASLRDRMNNDFREFEKASKRKWILTTLLMLAFGMGIFYFLKDQFEEGETSHISPRPIFVDTANSFSLDDNEIHVKEKKKGKRKNATPRATLRDTTYPITHQNEDKSHPSPPQPSMYINEGQMEAIKSRSKTEVPPPQEDCAVLTMSLPPYITPSCKGENSGKILFQKEAFSGGTEPYRIVLGNTQNKEAYYGLAAGEYRFQVFDAKGCKKDVLIAVPEKTCKPNKFIFNPDLGENWSLSPDLNEQCTVTIYNHSGLAVFKKTIREGESFEWTGIDQNGSLLESGLYLYVIDYVNGTKENGQVTISR